MKIVETDNFDGDYPDEKFLNLPLLFEKDAQIIADAINESFNDEYNNYPRYWKVVPNDYKLLPGFEP